MFKRNSYNETSSFILPTFKRNWEKKKLNPNDKLIFSREAARYFLRRPAIFQLPHIDIVTQISEQIENYFGQSIISAIPCFAGEKIDNINFNALCHHINYMDKNNGHVVIFVNGDSSENEENRYNLVNTLKTKIKENCQKYSFSIIDGWLFDGAHPLGLIRSILTDAIIYSALHLNVNDPIILSNDIDICYTPKNYGETVRRYFISDSCLDVLTGPLFYGYSYAGYDYIQLERPIPNLLLENRAEQARRLSKLLGDFYGNSFFETHGTHMAFRASAYCAADGYDVRLNQDESNELGIALFALRQQSMTPFPSVRNAIYAPEFCLATNPKKQLIAIANGLSITETWKNFLFSHGPVNDISLEEIARSCYQAENYISLEDCIRFLHPERVEHEKYREDWARIIKVFLRGVHDQTLSVEALTRYLNYCGVAVKIEDIENLPEDQDQARYLAEYTKPTPSLCKAIRRFIVPFISVHHSLNQGSLPH